MTLFESKTETFTFASAYRYHPLEQLLPLFIEGGIGIGRFNVVAEDAYPAYYYRSFVTAGVGATIEVLPEIFLIPSAEYLLIFGEGGSSVPRLVGNSQVEFALKLGYEFR